jgi:recombination protein RecT
MAQENKEEKEKTPDVKALIQGDTYRKQFAMAMPRHMKPDRFIRIAITAITKNPKLAQCTQASLVSCLLDLSALGLEPDGRRAHLIPFMNNKTGQMICTLLIDYKGLVELAMNTKEVSNIHADVICDEDTFVYNLGQVEKHQIDFRKDRGKMYAVYCIITMKDGTKKCEVMTKAEVDAIRKRSKSANDGPWVTDYNEMSKKTVFRRASKWIKLSPEVREKLEKDDGQFDVIPAAPGAPVIELKNDKNKKPAAQAGEVVDAEVEDSDAWKNVGDLARFGEANATKAKTLAQNITKCAEKLGKEKFLSIVGSQGVERMKEILKIEDLVKLTNELLDVVKDLE